MASLAAVTPSTELAKEDLDIVFQHLFRRLAQYRNSTQLYSQLEAHTDNSLVPAERKAGYQTDFNDAINSWAQKLLEAAWAACQEPGGGSCPELDLYADTSTGKLPHLPAQSELTTLLNTVTFLHITSSKSYSARTRSFLSSFGNVDEHAIVKVLKNPDHALEEAQKHAQQTKESHAAKGKTMRMVGMGLGAVAGGVLIGVTGGLAAPLVGAGVTTVLGWIGVGGTAAGMLASGLAGSSVVCGALFGVYGARSTASIVERYTREIRDLAILPVRTSDAGEESLGVRLCISGWLESQGDVTQPWTVFGGDDTFALQWEVEALQALSSALMTLIKSHAMKYVQSEIIKRTVFATLMSSLSPLALLKVGQIIDNPWMNAKALAVKAGAVLGELLAIRAFGNRPITLVGYSLGALVIFEALKHLASISPKESTHLVQDVFLYGTPTSTDPDYWTSIRRVVAGRLVNGYAKDDYVLAVLSRVSDASWNIAGLTPVDVKGVENVLCEEVTGHASWRGMIGRCLQLSRAPGIINSEVQRQIHEVAAAIEEDTKLTQEEIELVSQEGSMEQS
ncbi:hypothetical protein HGRIS_012838 [Hohenbuehelia grisea]|uniref:DUF726-domain-containing protein n=1 Tax=Hohenbuehelia grisea TaxID=104357 RepID=A0ABR3ITT2_9AGAR